MRRTGIAIFTFAILTALAIAPSDDVARRGAALFVTRFRPSQGLGPLFNGTSCAECHVGGGMGPEGLGIATRFGRLTGNAFDPMIGEGGPIARDHSVAEYAASCDLMPGVPAGANVTSVRNAPDLHGAGIIDAIPDRDIIAGAVERGDGVHGRVHLVGGRVGRFGWKADVATLRQFVAIAFRNELGITSPLAPQDLAPVGTRRAWRCAGESIGLEDDGATIDAVTSFITSLPPRAPRKSSPSGAKLFHRIGCDACHTPRVNGASIYSDLLLHDLGSELDDRVVQGEARGSEWRTTPLWGVGSRARLLHDGRARTLADAILAHGGEALPARQRFTGLATDERAALLAFLKGL